MEPKTVLVLFGAFVATTTAAPAPNNNNDMSATCQWQAVGGCETDWKDRCDAQCVGEAVKKGYKCEDVTSHITGSNCLWTYSTCECTCFSSLPNCGK
ncbi:uncharacterized protein BKA55DRAFT_531280 [Fusarium redolens]|uniref:Uncharacterized protein n=1 Tax=Fusarium redolens TaxID=48865 RepID=A0A9P9JSH0_FUSRE|nr:uncharacterized protein BKA55DRAFT_531280 [Fusarium redolens]KAH7202896.1 hypothetical protein BKA55DRAFT_531280 [Fusarium redolens]